MDWIIYVKSIAFFSHSSWIYYLLVFRNRIVMDSYQDTLFAQLDWAINNSLINCFIFTCKDDYFLFEKRTLDSNQDTVFVQLGWPSSLVVVVSWATTQTTTEGGLLTCLSMSPCRMSKVRSCVGGAGGEVMMRAF